MKLMKSFHVSMSVFYLWMAAACLSCDEETISGGPNNSIMEMAPSNKEQIAMGTFTSYAHNLSGKASLFCGEDGGKAIRLEDFNMVAGPDVYIFVSKSNNYSKGNAIEVVKLTSGYMDSDINFDFKLPEYTNEHKFVLVYCVQYNSLFGYAELK